jgi:hypothetical protein
VSCDLPHDRVWNTERHQDRRSSVPQIVNPNILDAGCLRERAELLAEVIDDRRWPPAARRRKGADWGSGLRPPSRPPLMMRKMRKAERSLQLCDRGFGRFGD